MSRKKSPLEPIIEDFIRNHPLTLPWPDHERKAFIKEAAQFIETRQLAEKTPKGLKEILE